MDSKELETLIIDVADNGVVTVTMNRPEKKNAANAVRKVIEDVVWQVAVRHVQHDFDRLPDQRGSDVPDVFRLHPDVRVRREELIVDFDTDPCLRDSVEESVDDLAGIRDGNGLFVDEFLPKSNECSGIVDAGGVGEVAIEEMLSASGRTGSGNDWGKTAVYRKFDRPSCTV